MDFMKPPKSDPYRPTRDDNLFQLWGLWKGIEGSSTEPLSSPWSRQKMGNCLRKGVGRHWMDSEDLVAFVVFRVVGAVLEVDLLATASGRQGAGFMSRLLDKIIEEFQDVEEIWLEVHLGNLRAQRFYKKFGFRQVRRRDNYYGDGQHALLLTLNIER